MDDLYDNLENYNEESTIAELQSENKVLKSKLEDYASALETLQKDFDKLSTEYKKLEANYSSLMKTAKAEIERKTQMIKNLNLEKDRIVIESYQNKKHAGSFHRNTSNERPKIKETKSEQKVKETKAKQNCKSKETNNTKVSTPSPAERNSKEHLTPKDTRSVNIDPHNKWLNLANSGALKVDLRNTKNNDEENNGAQKVDPRNSRNNDEANNGTQKVDPRFTKNNDEANNGAQKYVPRNSKNNDEANYGAQKVDPRFTKNNDVANYGAQKVDPRTKNNHVRENIVECNNTEKTNSRALIRNRRKSMPAVCLDVDKVSSDDDEIPSGGSSRENPDRRHLDRKFSDRQGSRVSETSSQEDRHLGHHEPFSDVHRSRQSRYDNIKTDSHRTRHKSSHRYKRQSPDRYRREPNEHHYEISRRRGEYDLYHKSEHDRRRLESPPRDNFHWRRNREPPRNNYDRSYERYNQDPERLQHRTQEKYPVKHKIQHNYDESESKRMKIEPHHRREEDLRLHEPFDYVNFSSCESPDYNHSDVSTHPVKEIKLYATTKLDDPRISSKKYSLNKDNGNVLLSTTHEKSVDIAPIDKTAWGIPTVNMPEALIRRPPMETDPVNEINVITDPVHDISIESGEISDHENSHIDTVKKEMITEHCFSESKSIGNMQKINCYKIPKLKKTFDENQSLKSSKVHDNKYRDKNKNKDTTSKSHNTSKLKIKPAQDNNTSEDRQNSLRIEEKTTDEDKHNRVSDQTKNELPFLGSSDLYEKQTNIISKEDLECDFEMSDDNCDNFQQLNNASKDIVNTLLERHKQDKEQNVETIKQSIEVAESIVVSIKAKNSNITQKDNKREKGTVETSKDKPYNVSKDIVSTHFERHKQDKEQNVETIQQSIDVAESCELNVKVKNSNIIQKESKQEKGTVETCMAKPNNASTDIVSTHLESQEQDKEQNFKTAKQSIDVAESSVVNIKAKNSNIKQKDNKRERGTVDTCKDKTIEDVKKSRNKKKPKCKDIESKFPEPIADKSTRRKEKENETKTKQIKTKFSELFDDSSSLISPEDLGLIAVQPSHTTVFSEKCIPLFEEAQDAADMDAIKETNHFSAAEKPNDYREHKQIEVIVDGKNTETGKTISQIFVNKPNEEQTVNKKVIENIYMNLEPGVPEKEKDVVKTVIISTGVQPQISDEVDKQRREAVPKLKTGIQGVTLQALATSTPQKILLPNVNPEVEAKLPDIGCTSDSRLPNLEDTATDNSYTNNTFDSQTNTTDVPDVRIVVKRRRKVVKK